MSYGTLHARDARVRRAGRRVSACVFSGESRLSRRPVRIPFRFGAPLAALALIAVAAVALGGCSGIGVLNALQPGGGVVETSGVTFRPGPRGKLDIYRPATVQANAPTVVFFYGGSWDEGARGQYRFVGRALARRGFVVMIPDYRVYPEVRWPTFLQDNAEAVRWARDHAAEHGGDPRRLFLMGHSAGAYNAMMLTLDRRWLAAVGMEPDRDLRGVIGLAGPYDFLPLKSEELKTIFGPEDQRPATQPINYVDGKNPPLLLGVDTADKVVQPGNTTRLAARVRTAGGPVEVREYKGLSHALLVAAIGAPLRFLAPVLDDAAAFIRTQSGAAS